MLRLLLFMVLLMASPAAAADVVRVVAIDGAVNPVTAEYLRQNLREAARQGERLVIIEIDTPGGLDLAMREIVKEVLGSPVPVAAYVTPSGSRAASAGAIIALAADVCAMAPGTAIGAAHPVSMGEKPDAVMQAKILNDAVAYVEGIAHRRGRNVETARRMVTESVSLSSERALQERVADFVVPTRAELLKQLEGRKVARDGTEITLRLAGAKVAVHEMSTRQKILDAIGDPNVAYILLMIGFLGLFFELSNPGVILPGVLGGIALILGLFALQSLPVNYAGVLLIILALVLFIAEIQVISHGMLTVAGIASLILGSLLLFESPEPYLRVSWTAIGATVFMVAGFCIFALWKAVAVQRLRPTTGVEGLVGEEGEALTDLRPEGKVSVHGEYWNAIAEDDVAAGERVVVVAVDGMRITVRRSLSGR